MTVREPLTTARLGEFVAVDYGGSIAEVLTYPPLPPVMEGEEPVERDSTPQMRGTLFALRQPGEFGTPLAEGTLDLLLQSWVLLNTGPVERAALLTTLAVTE